MEMEQALKAQKEQLKNQGKSKDVSDPFNQAGKGVIDVDNQKVGGIGLNFQEMVEAQLRKEGMSNQEEDMIDEQLSAEAYKVAEPLVPVLTFPLIKLLFATQWKNKEIGFIINGNYWQDFKYYTLEPFEQVSGRWLDELFVQAEFTLKDGGKLISFSTTNKYDEDMTYALLWITGSGEKYYKHFTSFAALWLESQGDKKIEHGIKYKDYKTEMREKSDSENER